MESIYTQHYVLPRKYSQFLRMYTSNNSGNLTLLLISQVRTSGIGGNSMGIKDDMTGGNAIKHYNMITLKIEKAGLSSWPTGYADLKDLPNSFPVRFKVEKIKASRRHSGMTCMGYFYKGSFDKKYNTVMIGADIGLHDGKSWKYKTPDGTEVEERFKGKKDMFNKISDDAVESMYNILEDAFLRKYDSEESVQVDDNIIPENDFDIQNEQE